MTEPQEPPPRDPPAIRRAGAWIERQWNGLGEIGRTGAVLGALLALALVVLAAWTDWVKDVKGTPLLVAAALPEKTAGVAAVAWLDPRGDGFEVRLWVLFRNDSAAAASDLRYLKLDTPGFRWVACMAGGGPDCRPRGRGRPPLERLPPVLRPGESRAVFGRLEPTGRASHGVSGVFGWRDLAGEHEAALIVAEAPADRGWQRSLAFAGRLVLFLRDLVKDLGLPVALALLAWFLKQRDDRREKKEQEEKQRQEGKAQKERDEREQSERRQAQLRETWNLLLPKSHANAENHYMPVVSRIQELEYSIGRVRPSPPGGAAGPAPAAAPPPPAPATDAERRLVWAVLRLFAQMRHLVLSIGGFYFHTRDGERVAARCWNRLYRGMETRLGRRELDAALDRTDWNESLDSFLRRWYEIGGLDPLLETVRGWTGEPVLDSDLALLELLSCAIEYEMNRTYELWYVDPEVWNDERFCAARAKLERAEADTPDRRELLDLLDGYAEAIRKRSREAVSAAEGGNAARA